MATAEHAQASSSAPARAQTIEQVYELHAPALRRRCLRLTSDPHAAEDLMQEVFTRFLARFPEVPADMNVPGYLHATARNVLWKQLRDDHEIADGDIEFSVGSDDDLEVDPERAALLVEQQTLVRRCSAVLTGRQRRALTLREVEGHSYAEIGSHLGIGSDAVAQVISRARVRLRVAVRRAHVDLDQLSPECRAMLGPLSDYLDGHATRTSGEIEAHLAECTSCRNTLAAFQGAGSRLRGLSPLAPLAGILARIGEAVRLGGGAPADAVRAGALAVAAAVAIGGGGFYAAHEATAGASARSVAAHAVAASVAGGAAAVVPAGSTPSSGAAPSVVEGHRSSGTTPVWHRSRALTPAHPRTVPKPRATKASSPVADRPAAKPAATPAATPVTPAATTPGSTPAAPKVTPPVSTRPRLTPPADPVTKVGGSVDPVTTPVGKVVTPVADKVVAPVVDKVVAPVTKKIVDPVVDKVVVPVVSKVVAPVTAPVTKALAPVTTTVTKALDPVTTPVDKAVAPVTTAVAPVTAPVSKVVNTLLPPATTSSAATQATTTAPAATTPAVTTPVVSLPSVKLGG